MARDKIKKDKTCLVCGEYFRATGKVFTCSGACRIKLARLKKRGKKPEYSLIAKTKGQELPDWIVDKLKDVGQISTQIKRPINPTPEKELPKKEENLTYFQKRQRGLV